ncbi:hypothetical protein PPERSA_00279 [Pseudocohnilembus persalinus]|uniref:Uncharacterized protein n=1 Tax=Pseudocohnilembus persalinus TaxID=266149 RepID=A0A0V0Q8X0_PSEPJ|nr:hypothetical protein PPERSA_00279 [Pseudocohnilembus persalinus]|eukprot:KRW98691.1 hypothetical protein PPERSA_00279 [Pseudocohnilembus persalinus]
MQKITRQILLLNKNCSILNSKNIYQFARFKKDFDSDLSTFENVHQYYQDLQRFASVSDRGILDLQQSQFQNMITLLKTKEEAQIVLDAYYNFIGHRVQLSQTLQDQFIQKLVQVEAAELTHDIIENHNFLMYYPSTQTIEKIIESFSENQDTENLEKILKAIKNNLLLKVNSQTFAPLFQNNNNSDNKLSPEIYQAIFEIYSVRQIALSEQQLQEMYIAVQNNADLLPKLSEYVEKLNLKSTVTQLGEALIKLRAGQTGQALKNLEETMLYDNFNAQSSLFQEVIQALEGQYNNGVEEVLQKIQNKFPQQKEHIQNAIQKLKQSAGKQEQEQKQEPKQEQKE